jgi:predicted phage replisome organizer
MAEVKWIKITTDIFDDEKILLIESLPDAYAIITVWFKLLCFAGKQNNSGVFMMNNRIAYTDKMLSTIFRMRESTVQLALKVFDDFGMIELVDGVITIPNWGKHQSLDKMEERNEYMRKYMKEYRTKQKDIALSGNTETISGLNSWKGILDYFDNSCAYCGKTDCDLEQEHVIPINDGGKFEMGNIIPACRSCNASKQSKSVFDWYVNQPFYNSSRMEKIVNLTRVNNVNRVNSLEEERDKDIEEDKEREIEAPSLDYESIVSLYRQYCQNLQPVRALNDKRKKTLKAWGDTDEMEQTFIKAGQSGFLGGQNDRGWKANFDWVIKPENRIKILEGNYDQSGKKPVDVTSFNNYEQRNVDYDDLEKKLLGWEE